MIEAGIQPGDLVIVERTNTPKVGDVVIAEVDGKWTMKSKPGQRILYASGSLSRLDFYP